MNFWFILFLTILSVIGIVVSIKKDSKPGILLVSIIFIGGLASDILAAYAYDNVKEGSYLMSCSSEPTKTDDPPTTTTTTSAKKTESTTTTIPTQSRTDLEVGEYIFFGEWEQDDYEGNGSEPIEWIVLSEENDRALLITRYGIDCERYNNEEAKVTWEDSYMRTWLREVFYNDAFTSEERERIQSTRLENDNNPEYSTYGGADTTDKVFLLSIEEANAYFDGIGKTTSATKYAMGKGAWSTQTCWWWLRSPGKDSCKAAYVTSKGKVNYTGDNVNGGTGAIRPAIYIDLT